VAQEQLRVVLGALYERSASVEAKVEQSPTAVRARRLRVSDVGLGVLHDTGQAPDREAERVQRGEELAVLSVTDAAHETARPEELADDVLIVVTRSAEPRLPERSVAFARVMAPGSRELEACGHSVPVLPRGFASRGPEPTRAHALCSEFAHIGAISLTTNPFLANVPQDIWPADL
jgi:hypothetical protein